MCPLTACWVPLFVRLSCIRTNVYLIKVYEKTGMLIALRMELALRWSFWCSKARSALASWSIDRRCVQEAKAFPWDEPLGLNRGTTDGACFFVFAVLSLAHDSNCLVVEWDTFWFGFNHPLEICWVTPSLATAFVYLSELGFLNLVCSSAVILLFVFLRWFGATRRLESYLHFLVLFFLNGVHVVQRTALNGLLFLCDSSVLCNPLESKGGISTYKKRGLTPSLTS